MLNYASAIGIDIGRNSLKIAVVKTGGEIVASRSYSINKVKSRDQLLTKLFEAIHDIRQAVFSESINPISIGIAAKGFIDNQSGIVLGPDQGIKNWTNVPLAKLVNDETGLPAFVDNDANMMTIAEHRFGAARGFKNVIFVALRSGIGGGIIINGKLHRGVANASGEIGQMIIKYDGEASDIGIVGTFEHHASASAVVRRYNEEISGTQISMEGRFGCKDIFELSYNGSPEAVKVVKENAEIVGIGLVNLISIFAPEIIIVGGGMSEAHISYFTMIKNKAIANSLFKYRSEVKIEKADLGSKAAFMGSAYYSLNRLAGKTL